MRLNRNFLYLAGAVLVLFAVGCNSVDDNRVNTDSNTTELRDLTVEEKGRDFAALIDVFSEFYAPLEYKEKRYGFVFEDIASEYLQLALDSKTDTEYLGVVKQFAARFEDGHVQIKPALQSYLKYTVPLFLIDVEGKAFVAGVLDDNFTADTGIGLRDEVLEVDGKSPFDYVATALKYEAFGNPITDKQFVFAALRRSSYIKELVPTKPTVHVKVKKPTGEIVERNLVWKVEENPARVDRPFSGLDVIHRAEATKAIPMIEASLMEHGREVPFYMTAEVAAKYKFVRVRPSEPYLQKYGLENADKVPDLYAALYRWEDQNFLLVRIATYSVSDIDERVSWYKALLDEYSPLVDKFVVDQTHNPGGKLDYAAKFVSLFAENNTRANVNFIHADRRWLNFFGWISTMPDVSGLALDVIQLGARLVEDAYDKGEDLAAIPLSLGGTDYVQPAEYTVDRKPVLLLVDELSGSCGDIVPMLMKANGLATLFGQRTMGLGGNVESVIKLPFSRTEVNLTRGFFTVYQPDGNYDLDNPVENNGVQPDIVYEHKADDFVAGYVGYVEEFSKAAAGL